MSDYAIFTILPLIAVLLSLVLYALISLFGYVIDRFLP